MMTPAEIKHAANAIWHLREHGDEIAERDALREEIEATRIRKVQTLERGEYELRKEIEEQQELKALINGKSLRSYASGSTTGRT